MIGFHTCLIEPASNHVITTKRAYEDLERGGYIESVIGKGKNAGWEL